MRLWTLLIILALAGGVAYLFIVRPTWFEQLLGKVEEKYEGVKGYPYADSPSKAMKLFHKAVENRQYEMAAKYCTGDYADELVEANDAARSVGNLIDELKNLLESKGLKKSGTFAILHKLDPFPKNFKPKDVPKKMDDDTYRGFFEIDQPKYIVEGAPALAQFLAGTDIRMYQQVLAFRNPVVEIVSEKKDDETIWKMSIGLAPKVALLPSQQQLISHFIEKHKTYENTLSHLKSRVQRESFASPVDFLDKIKEDLTKAAK